ncbi:hypothetical protein, partial [Streptomyces chiangmaiensis]
MVRSWWRTAQIAATLRSAELAVGEFGEAPFRYEDAPHRCRMRLTGQFEDHHARLPRVLLGNVDHLTTQFDELDRLIVQ